MVEETIKTVKSKTLFKEWKKDIVDHKWKIILAMIFLLLGIVLQAFVGEYVDEIPGNSVPDLILDHIPVINLGVIFTWGMIIVVSLFILYPLFYEPKKLHYSLGMLSLFLFIRSGFLVLTHLSAPLGAIQSPTVGIFRVLDASNDVFFSGHAGLPFLGFLVYKNKKIKYFMLIASIILAITALFMHVHYSIDVAAAYFITYGIYKIGDRLFDHSN